MNNGCCSKCQAKSKKTKKSKKLEEESSDEETEEQKKVPENENPKTDSKDEKEHDGTSDDKDKKKKKNTLTWQHSSTMKEKGHGLNNLSEKYGVKPPCFTARPMMHHGRGNPSNWWPISPVPGGGFPAFSSAPMYGPCGGGPPFPPYQSIMTQAPMFGPYCGGGPFQPYQSIMTQAPMYGGGVHIPPYPPMVAAAFPPYWQNRPFMDANPTTRYTSYRDNYSFGLF